MRFSSHRASVRPSFRGLQFSPQSCPPELVVSRAISDRRMSEPQRIRGEDGGDRSRIALAREDVDDHVGRMDALRHRLSAGGFHRRQSIGEHGGQDGDHLTIAIIGFGELASNPLERRRQPPILERSAVAQGSRLAGQDRNIAPRIVDCLAATVVRGCSATIRPSWRTTMRSA